MRPLIGVTPYYAEREDKKEYRLSRYYSDCLAAAGALPVILPFGDGVAAAELAERLDGLLLSGGEDVEPARYGQERLPLCGEVCPARDAFELALLAEAERRALPVLGICRGAQVLAVFYGGTVWQDLPGQLGTDGAVHRPEDGGCRHGADVLPATRLAAIFGAGPRPVNSSHHQAVRDTELLVSARAADGVIEAVERPGSRFVLGVQWHPERLDDGPLFAAFADACRQYRQTQ